MDSPVDDGDDAPIAACSFCGKSSVSPLVQAPGKDIYICKPCARIAGRVIDEHEAQSWPAMAISFAAGLALLIFVPLNWFNGDETDIGWLWSLIGIIIGIGMMAHVSFALYQRTRRS